MGAGYRDFVGCGPGEAAVGGAEHVGAEEAVALLLGCGSLGGLPCFGCVELLLLVDERGEGGYQEGAFGGFCDAGVAIVDGGVEDDLRSGPGEAFVLGADDLDSAEGADVGLAGARVGDYEFAARAPGEGGPAGEGFGRELDDGGGGEGEDVAACHSLLIICLVGVR